MAKKKSEPEHYVNNEEFLQAIIEHREKIERAEENEEPKEENIEDWEAQTAELEKDNTKTETE